MVGGAPGYWALLLIICAACAANGKIYCERRKKNIYLAVT
jgi:hypothetical protein